MRRFYPVFQLFFFLFLVMVLPVYAKEIPTLYRGIRPLGMGGAFTAVADDENALFYNPAGLKSSTTQKGVEILNPLFEFSQGSLDLVTDLADLQGGNISGVTDFLAKRIGEHQHLRASIFPHLLIPPFGIGILAQGIGDLEIRNPVFPEADTDIRIDTGLIAGVAHDFGRGLQGGVTVKYIQRQGVLKTFTAVDIAGKTFDPLETLKTQSDFALDIGGLAHLSEWTPMQKWDPTVGLTLQNITDLDFKDIGTLPQQINVGAAIHPDTGMVKSTVAFDFLDITGEVGTKETPGKRTHVGAEFTFPKVLSLRFGMNQDYFTGGLSIDFWILRLDYATFEEELGAFAGQRGDRRHLAQIRLGF